MDRFFSYTRLLATGAPVGGAQITVFLAGTANLATIFADNNPAPTPKPNPFLAASDGYFFFYAAAGRYDVRFEGGGPTPIPTPYTWGDVVLGESHLQKHVLATALGLGPDHTLSGLTPGHVLVATSATEAAFQNIAIAGVITDHGVLTGLLDDDHSQYPLLVGRLGGQILRGGTAPSEALELDGTLSATKGPILLNKSGGNVGIGVASPAAKLEVAGLVHATVSGFKFPDGTVQITAAAGAGTLQWITSGDNIHTANLGNVGINTTTPSRRLHVKGSATDTELLRLEAIVGRAAVLEFFAGPSSLWAKLSADAESCGLFNGAATGSIRVNQGTGNVSIGPSTAPLSAAPPMPLYLTTQAGVDDSIGIDCATGEQASVNFLQAGTRFGRVGGGVNTIGIDARVGGSVTGNVSINVPTGFVGVGTTTPARRLHVVDPTATTVRLESAVGTGLELFDSALGVLGLLEASPAAGFTNFSNGARTGSVLIRRETGFVGIVPDFGGFGVNPARPLEVESLGSVPVQLRLRGRAAGGAGVEFYSGPERRGAVFVDSSNVVIDNGAGGSQSIAIAQTTGFVGVGTFAPIEKLDVAGNVHTASVLTSSDARFKADVQGLRARYGDVLGLLRQLRGVCFTWNDFYRNDLSRGAGVTPGELQVGLIAQEVLPLFPELVSSWKHGDRPPPGDPLGDRYYGLYYDRFVPVLIEALKELLERIEALEEAAA